MGLGYIKVSAVLGALSVWFFKSLGFFLGLRD